MEICTEKANEDEALPKYSLCEFQIKVGFPVIFMRARDMIINLEFRNFDEGNSRYGRIPGGREAE